MAIFNPLTIEGKTIVITGGASGIGRQCAIDFSNAGANLVLLDINEEQLEITKGLCNPHVKCSCYRCDLTDAEGLEAIVSQAVAENGLINGMLHCAGIEKTLPYNKFSSADYDRIYSVNVVGAMNLLKYLTKKSNRAENAKYVLIASITAVVGRPGVAAYAASKGAINAAVHVFAKELAFLNNIKNIQTQINEDVSDTDM